MAYAQETGLAGAERVQVQASGQVPVVAPVTPLTPANGESTSFGFDLISSFSNRRRVY